MALKGTAEVAEVRPRCIRWHEASGEVKAGMIVHREQKKLFGGRRPPLVDGAIVLPKFPDLCPTKSTIGTRLLTRRRNEMQEVCFDISLNAGASASKAAKS